MVKAGASFVISNGGLEATGWFTRIWLALFGEWSWDTLAGHAAGDVLLASGPRSPVRTGACWARQTARRDDVVATSRPGATAPSTSTSCAPASRRPRQDGVHRVGVRRPRRVLKLYHRSPSSPDARWRSARGRVDHRPPGSRRWWGGIPASARLLDPGAAPAGLPLDHPVIVAACGASTVSRCTSRPPTDRSGGWRPASRRSGTLPRRHRPARRRRAASDPAVKRAAEWLLAEKSRSSATGRAPARARAGRVGVRVANDKLPDIDDRRGRARTATGWGPTVPGIEGRGRTGHGLDGRHAVARCGWGAFDADNVSPAHRQAAVCDFVRSPTRPSADVTAHVVER